MRSYFAVAHWSARYYCGGNYPTNDENVSVTFDLTTGKKIDFDDLFENYEANKDQILKIIFAPQLVRTESLPATGSKTNEENSDCDNDTTLFTSENLGSTAFAYDFSEKGLMVQPRWPHVIEACTERVTVPYERLERFGAPDGILARSSSLSEYLRLRFDHGNVRLARIKV
jgi:hypothetical protein